MHIKHIKTFSQKFPNPNPNPPSGERACKRDMAPSALLLHAKRRGKDDGMPPVHLQRVGVFPQRNTAASDSFV